MANRIDSGVQPTAHSAVQAAIVQAQRLADQSGKRVGLVYDLARDEITLVDLSSPAPEGTGFFRILAPANLTADDSSAASEKSGTEQCGAESCEETEPAAR